MPNLNFEQVEASLKAARRRSQRRFFIFIALILGIWGATYVYTKGEFYFFTKKITDIDTIVVVQTAAIGKLDSIIDAQDKLIVLLQDSLHTVRPRPTARPVETKDPAIRLAEQYQLRERERKRRDSILLRKKLEIYKDLPPLDYEQRSLNNIQASPKN